jgi:hypothetical protein
MYVYVKGREEKRTRWIESGMGREMEGEKGGGKWGIVGEAGLSGSNIHPPTS